MDLKHVSEVQACKITRPYEAPTEQYETSLQQQHQNVGCIRMNRGCKKLRLNQCHFIEMEVNKRKFVLIKAVGNITPGDLKHEAPDLLCLLVSIEV